MQTAQLAAAARIQAETFHFAPSIIMPAAVLRPRRRSEDRGGGGGGDGNSTIQGFRTRDVGGTE